MRKLILSTSHCPSNRSIFLFPAPALVRALTVAVMILTATTNCGIALAQDWPQINGPTRDGVAEGETLLSKWPANGPAKVWSHTIGQGFAGPVIKDNQLIVFHRPGKDYLVEKLAADTGKLLWNRKLASEYQGGGPDQDLGPKAVPLIHDDRVFLLGTGGNLFCLAMADGKTIWQKNVLSLYKSPSGYFGSGSSPIVIGERLLLNVGGQDAGVVAFDINSGDEIWKAFDDRASYSSPIEVSIDSQKTAVFVTRMHLVGIDPTDGKVLFKTPFGKRGPTVNGAMPVFANGNLFINSAYGVGANWLKLAGDHSAGMSVTSVWANDDSFSSQYSTPILIDGYLYGTAGREDFKNGSFRCVEAESGKVMWSQAGVAVGHTLKIGDKLVVLDSGGTLSVVQPDEKKYAGLLSAKVFDGGSRSMPAFANGRLYARSNANRKVGELSCFQLGKSK